MERFLKAKHWQLFLLLFGIPFIFQVVMMISIVTSHTMVFSYFKFFPLVLVIYVSTFFSWLWSVALGLQPMVPATVKMKVARFKIFLVIPLVYILIVSVLLEMVFSGTFDINPKYILVIVPVHLFSVFCILHSLYFVAKTFKTVELQRQVRFEDFAGEFFMLLFFPVGVWILQPKINKMAGY